MLVAMSADGAGRGQGQEEKEEEGTQHTASVRQAALERERHNGRIVGGGKRREEKG